MGTFLEEASGVAKRPNLLGSSEAASPNFPGTSKRISFAEAEKIRTDILENGISDGLTAFLLYGLIKIADSSLCDAELSRFFAATGACKDFARGKWRDENYSRTTPSANIFLIASAIHNISSAVTCLEGNVPPNHLGYMFDQTNSAVRRDELAVGWLSDALDVFQERPDIVGFTDPRPLFNAIADRIDAHRPTFMGRRVQPDVPTPRMS